MAGTQINCDSYHLGLLFKLFQCLLIIWNKTQLLTRLYEAKTIWILLTSLTTFTSFLLIILPPSFWLQMCRISATLSILVLAVYSVEFSSFRLFKPSFCSPFRPQLKQHLFREVFSDYAISRNPLSSSHCHSLLFPHCMHRHLTIFCLLLLSLTWKLHARTVFVLFSSLFPVFKLVPGPE